MSRPQKWAGFRSVLCPVDFSDHSQRALEFAAAVARRRRARLKVLYVNDPLLVAAAAAALHDRRLASRSARELVEFINTSIAAKTRSQLRLTSHVSAGQPADRILGAARRHGSDLIVLGTHGLTGVDRLLIGSTTLSVLQRTTVPVLAVAGTVHPGDFGTTPWPGERIVAAVDLDQASAGDVERAARIAQWFDAELLLVHVVAGIGAPAWLSADLSAHERIRVARAQQQMDALAANARRHVKTTARVIAGDISDEIAALAATERTGLLLTALHDRTRWFGANRGSVSYHVLSHAVTPVLAVPPSWRPRQE